MGLSLCATAVLQIFVFAGPAAAQTVRQDAWPQNQWKQWQQNSFGQSGFGQYNAIDGMAAAQASAAGVPVSLVERVIKRESGGNPRAVNAGNYGLMQIRLGTARAMGYSGSAAGLLDPETNMTYAVRYLAGAYRAAGGDENRAVALYARGYYDVAKAQGNASPYGFAPQPQGTWPQFGWQQPDWQPTWQTAQTLSPGVPVYRVKHYRRHAV